MSKLVLITLLVGIAGLPAYSKEMVVAENSRSAVTCELCNLVLTAAKSLIASNKSEEAVVQFIEDQLCSRLGTLKDICNSYMESEGKQIIYELAHSVDPSTICTRIGLCSTRAVEVRTVNCLVCKLVMTDVQSMLKNNASEAQILVFIENKLCNATGPLYPVCKIAIDSFGPQILKMLAAQVDPAKICEFIGMCTARTFVKKWIVEMPKIESKNAVVCTICQYVVEFLDTQLKNNKTEAAIEHALENVCKVAPSSLRPQCTSLVNQYGIYLVELLIELADPLKVCQVATLC